MTVVAGLTPDMVPTPSPGVEMVAIGDETVLIDEHTGHIEVVNHTASIVWQCLDGQSSLGEIATDLADVFGVDREVVLTDVLSLVTSLATLHYLVDDTLETEGDTEVSVPTPDFSGVPPNA
jgi:hypothetical protein